MERGCLVIADITGYTAYLNASELDHAKDTLASLLNLMIAETRAPLVLSRTAGDAVISYALEGSFTSGRTIVELLERCYVRFRHALELMVLNTTCTCRACANIGALDLKFFVHHGEFAVQQLGGHDELVGSDVNVLHRLTKNSITEATGITAYCAWTQPTAEALGMPDFFGRMPLHEEHYDDVGAVTLRVQDLAPVWERDRERGGSRITSETTFGRLTFELPVPQPRAWEFLTDPEMRAILVGSDESGVDLRDDGRLGPGAVYRCVHGTKAWPQAVVDWRPFDEYTVLTPGMFPGTSSLATAVLEGSGDTTTVTLLLGRASGPPVWRRLEDLATVVLWRRLMAPNVRAFVEAVREREAAARPADGRVADA